MYPQYYDNLDVFFNSKDTNPMAGVNMPDFSKMSVAQRKAYAKRMGIDPSELISKDVLALQPKPEANKAATRTSALQSLRYPELLYPLGLDFLNFWRAKQNQSPTKGGFYYNGDWYDSDETSPLIH